MVVNHILFINGGVKHLFIPSPAAFRLEGDVADAMLLVKHLFNLGVDFFYLTKAEVITV